MTPLYELNAKLKSVAESNSQITQIIYHGSSILFDCPKCCPSARVDALGTTVWKGEAVFATFDRRIALHYTVNRVEGYTSGVDLTAAVLPNQPLAFMIFGGTSKEDALNKLYGTEDASEPEGYIYQMDAKFFHHEKGLGIMERISKDTAKTGFLIKVEKINRRKEIEAYIKTGLIKIDWAPLSNIQALINPKVQKKENKKSRCCCF